MANFLMGRVPCPQLAASVVVSSCDGGHLYAN